MIQKMQTLMIDWCGYICATCGLIALMKTRLFQVSFFLDCNAWDNETKDSLPGDITLHDKDDNMYTVNREEPTTHFESLGLQTNITNT